MSDLINSNNKENYGKFVVDNSSDIGPGRTETPMVNEPNNDPGQFGQVKYAKRAGCESIYRDATRFTENDKLAEKRFTGEKDSDADESQDGMY